LVGETAKVDFFDYLTVSVGVDIISTSFDRVLWLKKVDLNFDTKISVADSDPGSGASLNPVSGAGIRDGKYPDPGSGIRDVDPRSLFGKLGTVSVFWINTVPT
jgi:hypothetical protein